MHHGYSENKSIFGPPPSSRKVICQYSENPGHTTKVCYKFHGYPPRGQTPTAMIAKNAQPSLANTWVSNYGVIHHVTNELQNLSVHAPHYGSDQLMVGDGLGLTITHTGRHSIPNHLHHLHLMI